MKKILVSLLILVGFQSALFAQANVEDVFKKAETAIEDKSSKKLLEVLGSASSLFKTDFKGVDPEIRNKFFGQADDLMLLVPSTLAGKVDFVGISGVFKRLKLLYAANKLKNALSEGRSGMKGNSDKISSALKLIENSSEGLKMKDASSFDSLLNKTIKSASKLAKGGLFKKCKEKTAEKQINALVKMILANV